MSAVDRYLAPFISHRFPIPEGGGSGPRLCAPLQDLYATFNGAYFWNGALLVRPAHGESSPLGVTKWNDPALWKDQYDDVCSDITFFSEDAFGVQFGVDRGRVVQFDPETAKVAAIADTLDGWFKELLGEPEFYTGFPVLAAWERKNHPVQVGYRLMPKQLFMLGGEFHSDNMICKPDVEGMRIRGQFWRLTRDLPEGARIEFKVAEDS